MQEGRNGEGSVLEVRGCLFPKALSYDVANHIWYEPVSSGEIRIGMTCVAVALASFRIFAVTPRRMGRTFDAGSSIATVESSKWVGPARAAFDGVITATNEPLSSNPSWLANDPYGKGWLVLARPQSSEALGHLVSGDDIANAYRRWMDDNDFPGCAAESS